MVDRHYSLNLKPWSARTLYVYAHADLAQKYSVGLQEICVSRLCSQEENSSFLSVSCLHAAGIKPPSCINRYAKSFVPQFSTSLSQNSPGSQIPSHVNVPQAKTSRSLSMSSSYSGETPLAGSYPRAPGSERSESRSSSRDVDDLVSVISLDCIE
jgi:hypothetical protein